MNPFARAEIIAALLDVNVHVASRLDNQGKMPMDYNRLLCRGIDCNHNLPFLYQKHTIIIVRREG